MVALGYPGDARALVLVGFGHGPVMLRRLPVGDRVVKVTSKQASSTASVLVSSAWYLTVVSWLTYPFVYFVEWIPNNNKAGTQGVEDGGRLFSGTQQRFKKCSRV